jgi:hypothetical protein
MNTSLTYLLVVAWRDWIGVTTFIKPSEVCMLESFSITSFKFFSQTTTYFMLRLNFHIITWEAYIVYILWIFFPILITCFKCQFIIELTCLIPYCISGGCLVVTTKENDICIAIQTSLWWFWIIPCQSNVLDFTSFVKA